MPQQLITRFLLLLRFQCLSTLRPKTTQYSMAFRLVLMRGMKMQNQTVLLVSFVCQYMTLLTGGKMLSESVGKGRSATTGLVTYVCVCTRPCVQASVRACVRVCVSVCNSKHWFTTSFLGGRCRKAMLRVWHHSSRHGQLSLVFADLRHLWNVETA